MQTTVHRFTPQRAFAVLAPVEEGRVKELRAFLARMVPSRKDEEPNSVHDVETNPIVPFGELRRVHFARFVIVERSFAIIQQSPKVDDGPRPVGPWLVFSTNYDGTLNAHLAELMRVARRGVDQIFRHCTGWPADGTEREQVAFLKKHAIPYEAFFVGHPGVSVDQIRMEEKLRQEIGEFLDSQPQLRRSAKGQPAVVRDAIIGHLRKSEFSWALNPVGKPPILHWLLRWYGWKAAAPWTFLVLMLLLPILLWLLWPHIPFGTALVWFVAQLAIVGIAFRVGLTVLRERERTDVQLDRLSYDTTKTVKLTDTEDKIVQNQMSILVDIKPGLFRKALLKAVLSVIDVLARYVYTNGKLGDIPSIHFARWIIVDDGRALLFFSNYTGSWENYLGDFIEKAAVGLTAVWSNTVLFPRTVDLVKEGARDERRFKVWTRSQQMLTDVWYSAYKTLSSVNIKNNRAIREGLSRSLTPEELARWVQRL